MPVFIAWKPYDHNIILDFTTQKRFSRVVVNVGCVQQYNHTLTRLPLCPQSRQLPAKLNCIIQPLMASIRKEPETPLQAISAKALAQMLPLCADRQPSPANKIFKNICAMACGDPADTPFVGMTQAELDAAFEPTPSTPAELPPPAVARRGTEVALRHVAHVYGPSLLTSLPPVTEVMLQPLSSVPTSCAAADPGANAPAGQLQALIHALQVYKVLVPSLVRDLLGIALHHLPHVSSCCMSANAAVHKAAARCLCIVADALPQDVLPPLLEHLVPMMNAAGELFHMYRFASIMPRCWMLKAPPYVAVWIPSRWAHDCRRLILGAQRTRYVVMCYISKHLVLRCLDVPARPGTRLDSRHQLLVLRPPRP